MKPTTLRALVGHCILAIAILPIILMSFQNCAPKSFVSGTDGTDKPNIPQGCEPPTVCPVDPTKAFSLVAHTIRTEMNTPKEWTAPFDGDKQTFILSLEINKTTNAVNIPNIGRVETTDAAGFKLKYTPEFGYRGKFSFWLYAVDPTDKTMSQIEVFVEVGNTLNFFQPALAVRGSGCVMCHADVRSNIVTDLGYGNNYHFGQNIAANSGLAWNFGTAYGDFEAYMNDGSGNISPGNFANLNHSADKKVYVPAGAAIPVVEARTKSGASTLAGYLTARFAASSFASTRTPGKVIEKSKVFIGAPTAARIQQAFNWTQTMGDLVYQMDPASGTALSGLKDNGTHVTNDGTLICDGDVMINGPVLLKDLKVRTKNGCRLYVAGTVFIYGGIDYEVIGATTELRNLQITSSSAILMGLGSLYNGATHCEQNANAAFNWYYDRAQNFATEAAGLDMTEKGLYEKSIKDSAYNRLVYFWPNTNHRQRNDSRDGKQIGQQIFNEMVQSIGEQKDAACRSGGRGVSYSRLLLNAPRVESRYNGDFVGSIVSEVMIPALGQFKFEFDPVFNQIPILPKLQDSDYLHVE